MSVLTQDHEHTSGIFHPVLGGHDAIEPKPPDLIQSRVFQPSLLSPENLVSNGPSSPSFPTPDPYPQSPTSPLLAPLLHPLSFASLRAGKDTAQPRLEQQHLHPSNAATNATTNGEAATSRSESLDANCGVDSVVPPISRVRNYIVLGDVSVPGPKILPAVDTVTGLRHTCKVIAKRDYPESLRANYIMDSSDYIMNIEEVIISSNNAFAFFKRGECDLQSFMQKKRLLKEHEIRHIFKQVVTAVDECHRAGIIVKDLKMKKIIITDTNRFDIKLESLDGAKILDNEDDDRMTDRLGCPAYVSPELLRSSPEEYSGKKCDMWSLGIILYALLVGRYPFYDKEPVRMLAKINRGRYHIPERVSWLAKSVINSLLVSDPGRRMTTSDVLCHPWFRDCDSRTGGGVGGSGTDEDSTADTPRLSGRVRGPRAELGQQRPLTSLPSLHVASATGGGVALAGGRKPSMPSGAAADHTVPEYNPTSAASEHLAAFS